MSASDTTAGTVPRTVSTPRVIPSPGWNVTVEQGTHDLPDVTATTVFFTEAPGEREAAGQVAKILDNAAVELRRSELADWPPGLIVTVTG